MTNKSMERAYKSLWHLAIAAVGFYELQTHKTRLSKFLACGLIAFHTDAAICDALDVPTTPQRILRSLANERPVSSDNEIRSLSRTSGVLEGRGHSNRNNKTTVSVKGSRDNTSKSDRRSKPTRRASKKTV